MIQPTPSFERPEKTSLQDPRAYIGMGRVDVTAKVTNNADLFRASEGDIDESDVRSVDVEFMVDTGTTFISLPAETIAELGLRFVAEKRLRTANGVVTRKLFGTVRVEYEDRDAVIDVLESGEGTPPLLGYIPLEMMDLIVNPRQGRLEGNPDHDGEYVLEML